MATRMLYGVPVTLPTCYRAPSGEEYRTWEECYAVATNTPSGEIEKSEFSILALEPTSFVYLRKSFLSSIGNNAFGIDERLDSFLIPVGHFQLNLYSINVKIQRFCEICGIKIKHTIGWYVFSDPTQGQKEIRLDVPPQDDDDDDDEDSPIILEPKKAPTTEKKKSGWIPL